MKVICECTGSHPAVFAQVTGALYSYVDPTPTGTRPYLAAGAPAVAQLVGLDPRELQRPEFAASFSGNAPLLAGGARPYAHVYGGHQFGSVRPKPEPSCPSAARGHMRMCVAGTKLAQCGTGILCLIGPINQSSATSILCSRPAHGVFSVDRHVFDVRTPMPAMHWTLMECGFCSGRASWGTGGRSTWGPRAALTASCGSCSSRCAVLHRLQTWL